jgi:hypothetical protein
VELAGRTLVLGAAVVAGCAAPSARKPVVQSTVSSVQQRFAAPSGLADGGSDLPAVCRQRPRPLDAAGRTLLVALEGALADDVLLPTPMNGDLELVGDLRSVLRQYPDVDLRFIFPIPRALSSSRFRAGTAETSRALAGSDHPVFYLELSEVGVVGPPEALGLVLDGGAGPAGPAPRHGVWAWGIWGRFCMLRDSDGRWSEYPIGPTMVS